MSKGFDSEPLLERVEEEPAGLGVEHDEVDPKFKIKGRVQFEMPVEFVNVSHGSGTEDEDHYQLDSIELEDNYYCLAIYAFFVTEEELEHDATTKNDERVYANKVMD